eukprot:5238268-Amphidinium_carterae.1
MDPMVNSHDQAWKLNSPAPLCIWLVGVLREQERTGPSGGVFGVSPRESTANSHQRLRTRHLGSTLQMSYVVKKVTPVRSKKTSMTMTSYMPTKTYEYAAHSKLRLRKGFVLPKPAM